MSRLRWLATSAVRQLRTRSFVSLGNPNFRLYFVAQIVSSNGTWMQLVAESWLIIQHGGSGVALGIATALQFAPILVLGPLGGVLVDRWSKRRVVIVTQCLSGTLAFAVGMLAWAGLMRIWMVWLSAFLLGFVNVVNQPARQALAAELVGPEQVANGVALTNMVGLSARALGPGLSGLLITRVGIATCFLLNAASYLAVVSALVKVDTTMLFTERRVVARRGQVREGLRYARQHAILRSVLLIMVVVGIFGVNFQLLLTLLASQTFHRGSELYGTLMSCLGVGMIVGSLISASWHQPTMFGVGMFSLALGGTNAVVGLASNLPFAFAGVLLLGAAAGMFLSSSAGLLQLHVSEGMRGRVMALYSVAFLGTALIGGPAVGWVAQAIDPQAGFLVAAVACAAAAVLGLRRPTGAAEQERATRTTV